MQSVDQVSYSQGWMEVHASFWVAVAGCSATCFCGDGVVRLSGRTAPTPHNTLARRAGK
jgi:hypothetical protein